MGVEKKIEFIEMPEELKGKYQYFTKADPRSCGRRGIRKPFTSLEDGVREYVEFLESVSELVRSEKVGLRSYGRVMKTKAGEENKGDLSGDV